METVKLWFVNVYRTPWDWNDGNVAWTEGYETQEEAESAARLIKHSFMFYETEVFEDEVDIMEADYYKEVI